MHSLYHLPLFFFWFDYSIVAVMAFVNYVDLAGFCVAENKELMIEHVHLENCFLYFHWFYREAFGLNDSIFIWLIHFFHKLWCEGSGFHPFGQFVFVLYDLTEQGVDNCFQSIFTFISGSFSTEEKSFRFDGYLNSFMVAGMNNGYLRLCVVAEKAIKFGKFFLNSCTERIFDTCVSSGDVNLQRFNPFLR